MVRTSSGQAAVDVLQQAAGRIGCGSSGRWQGQQFRAAVANVLPPQPRFSATCIRKEEDENQGTTVRTYYMAFTWLHTPETREAAATLH